MKNARIVHLFISPKHNFFGHKGRMAGTSPMEERDAIECRASHGIVGDRFYDYKPDYKGQITFFAMEAHQHVREKLNRMETFPSEFRRNVLTSGLDLNAMIGVEFEMQGVRFLGTEESRPCDWLDAAIAPGTKAALVGNGGLRARILSDGFLRPGPCELQRIQPNRIELADV